MKHSHIMQFGKHKGRMVGSIPAKYLLWLFEEMIKNRKPYTVELREYISENLERLLEESIKCKNQSK